MLFPRSALRNASGPLPCPREFWNLVSNVSFSKATAYINDFFHRDDSNSLCYKTVEEFVERTGRRICESYKAASDAFLAEANIDTGDCVISKESAIVEEARLCR